MFPRAIRRLGLGSEFLALARTSPSSGLTGLTSFCFLSAQCSVCGLNHSIALEVLARPFGDRETSVVELVVATAPKRYKSPRADVSAGVVLLVENLDSLGVTVGTHIG